MDEKLKGAALEVLHSGMAKIIENYTKNALLLNACHVSADRYEHLTKPDGLSTTLGIPPSLRLDHEIDYQYTNDDLVNEYKKDVVDVILKNYVIVSISIVDGILEELYELFLSTFELDISDSKLSQYIYKAWSEDNILNYFIAEDKANLKKPNDLNTPFNETFMRYKELRLIRHSLVHQDGVISQKNLTKLTEYKELTPDVRKDFAIINGHIIKDGKVSLSINTILLIRKFLHNFLIYQLKSVNEA